MSQRNINIQVNFLTHHLREKSTVSKNKYNMKKKVTTL